MTAALFAAGADDLRTTISGIFAERVDTGRTPGTYYAVFSRAGIEFEGGFGQRRLGGAVPDAQTAFRIASCTKSFTAATILLLRDRGDLVLDAPITDFVPAFRPGAPEGDPVTPTVRMLLTMSGGLPTDDPWGDRQEAMTTAELNTYLAAGVPFVSVPGTAFEYSNLGYALLGQVIEAVTRRPYIDVVTSEILAPLKLTSTGFEAQGVPAADLAVGYRMRGDEWLELPFSGPGAFTPMAGVFTTAHDLARWAGWLSSALDPDAAPDPSFPAGPLSAASRREMQQVNRSIPIEPRAEDVAPAEYGYGFGLFVEKDPVWGNTVYHSGGYPGFSTHMRWNAPAGVGVVGFENATYSGALVPVAQALRAVLDFLGKPDLSAKPWPQTLAMQARAEQLIRAWDDRLANEIFTANVALDRPYTERAAAIAKAIESVGGLTESAAASAKIPDATGDSPAHLVWHLPGRSGRLRCQLRLAPTSPALVQTLVVTAEPAAPAP